MASCGLLGVEGQDSTQTTMTTERRASDGKMIRKRMASELLNNGVDYHPYRLGRRISSNHNNHINQTTSTPIFNYSTINNNDNTMLLPSSTNMTSGGSGFLSTPTAATAATARTTSTTIDVVASSNPPAVCGFSGLPLFPPTVTTTTCSTPSMEDSSSTAWIDGIIKDLIQNSTNVSIPQLIHNVREIIYPCNPNLAALL